MIHAPLDLESLVMLLGGRRLGNRIVYLETVGSTNDRALEAAEAGLPEGALVLSEEQTRGRGRRGRAWSSPSRRGIYASLVLRPRLDASRLPLVGFAASLGIARALEEMIGRRTEIRWPNDLLVGGKKVAGILSESRGGAERASVVVGLGLNVNHALEDFPPDLRITATSLRLASGRPWDRTALLPAILARWEEEYFGLLESAGADTLARWESYSSLQDGAPVTADLDGEILRGRYRGVTPDGEMRLETEQGTVRRLAYGDVRLLRSEA